MVRLLLALTALALASAPALAESDEDPSSAAYWLGKWKCKRVATGVKTSLRCKSTVHVDKALDDGRFHFSQAEQCLGHHRFGGGTPEIIKFKSEGVFQVNGNTTEVSWDTGNTATCTTAYHGGHSYTDKCKIYYTDGVVAEDETTCTKKK